MRIVLQRVTEAHVKIAGQTTGSIGKGYMILLGIETTDEPEDIEWLCQKIVKLRVFPDAAGKMNKSIQEVEGAVLLISQFTLHASTRKGNRPSYIRAAHPDQAIPLYEKFVRRLSILLDQPVATGTFGADMKVSLINDGPVTIIMDSKNKE